MPTNDMELYLHIVYDLTPAQVHERSDSHTVYGIIFAADEACPVMAHRTTNGLTFKHTHIQYDLPVQGVVDVYEGEENVTATVENVRAYWEYTGEDRDQYPPAGCFAPDRGYTRLTDPNVKYNCIAQALDYPTAWIEPDDKGVILENDYTEMTDRNDMATGQTYVLISTHHGARITQVDKENNHYTVQEKNAESGVYQIVLTLAQLNEKFEAPNYRVYHKN